MVKRGAKIGSSPLIAGVIAEEAKKATIRKAVKGGADILEFRADTFKSLEIPHLSGEIKKVRDLGKLPVLLTVRSKKEGGARSIPERERERIFEALIPFADMIDIELSSSGSLKNVLNFARRQGKKVILSYHNFKSTPSPEKLRAIVKKGRAAGADLVKIAACAKGPEDIKKLTGLLMEFKDLIVIGMGPYGAFSRVFFPFVGSAVTYGSISAKTAPGQLTLDEIKKEFDFYDF